MASLDKVRVAKLMELGLSEYAARAYVALLDLGVAEARRICALSRVPSGKLYKVLDQLHAKGLVTVIPEVPKRYAPVPIGDYLHRLEREREAELVALSTARPDLERLLAVVANAHPEPRSTFLLVKGRANVLSKCVQLIDSATRDVLILGSHGSVKRMEGCEEALGRAAQRGVRVRVALPLSAEAARQAQALAAFTSVRARLIDAQARGANVDILVFDDAQVIVSTFAEDPSRGSSEVGFFTDEPTVVAALTSVIEPHWTQAPDFQVQWRAVEGGATPDSTRVYTNQAEAYAALSASFKRGLTEFRAVNGLPAKPLTAVGRELGAALQAGGGRFRAILNFQDRATAEIYLKSFSEEERSEIRHLAPTDLIPRFWLVDEREATFSATRPAGIAGWDPDHPPAETPDLLVHTTNASTVRSLSEHFEVLWARASPLEARFRELLREGSPK